MTSGLNKMNNLTQRVIIGIIGIAVVIGGIYWHFWSYFVLFFLICLFSLTEFYTLVKNDGKRPLKTAGILSGMLLYALSFLNAAGILNGSFGLFLVFPLIAFLFIRKLYDKEDKEPFTSIAFTILGIVYVALPFSLMHFIVFISGKYDYSLVLGILVLIWATDTGAYFAGVSFGKRKLFERISPKKSWEGFFGGMLLNLVVAWVLSIFFTELTLLYWLIAGLIIVVAGTFGDLAESMFKRSIQIKDSGSTLPGHGGFLDRFDALFLAVPFLVAFFKVLETLNLI